MANNATWWKNVPCHFTWGLEEDANLDYKSLNNSLESKLENWTEEHRSPPCHPLIFIGYLSVSTFKGVTKDPIKAQDYFLKVEKEAEKIVVEEEKAAFLVVILANRLWMAERSNDWKDETKLASAPQESIEDKEDIMRKLEQMWDEKNEKLQAYIEYIGVFALTRLGNRKYREAERRCRHAISVITDDSEWNHTLGCLIGRQARINVASSKRSYADLEEEIHFYEKAVELDPSNDLARCDLAHALIKIPRRTREAWDHLNKVQETSCSMILKKGRFYRFQKDYRRSLFTLKRGERFSKPRGELFFQIALVYAAMASQSGRDRNYRQKDAFVEKEMNYLDRCIQVEPSHQLSLIWRAQLLGDMRRYDEGKKAFQDAIQTMEGDTKNVIQAQFRYAEFLTARNRGLVTKEVALVYEEVISAAAQILQNAEDDEHDEVTTGVKKFITQAKRELEKFYGRGHPSVDNLETQLADFHF